MSPYVLMLVLSSLGLGTALTFSSSHWLLAWMGLEINTLAMLPLMARHHHPRAVEATTKYFLTQATAAAIILFASLSNSWFTGQWTITELSDPLSASIATMGLALKIGLAPLHFWLPEVLQGIPLLEGLILSTWQKLAPFALILQLSTATPPVLLTSLALVSALMGGWGGINQTQLRKLLAYSSTAHLGWMIVVCQLAPPLTLLALFTYIFMTSAAFLTFYSLSVTKTFSLAQSWTKFPALTALACLVMLSLGGLPPLTGFMPKWFILKELVDQAFPIAATLIALSALLSLYFYLRLTYLATLTLSPHTVPATSPWIVCLTPLPFPLPLFLMATFTLLPLSPTILTLLT
uniref:NADH-ubiquinone oxidoreductase chain 2 n=1 Tax=Jenkinsia sp. CL54 TaxID=466963 RepID=E6N193_9TELE|nr:NADH dehydrogenase subunit 2 [Jenkinsia sp. CL54]BAJ54169.1 NADH dehydrogenase subunit 2 [Jenkinsia sp. CL54]